MKSASFLILFFAIQINPKIELRKFHAQSEKNFLKEWEKQNKEQLKLEKPW